MTAAPPSAATIDELTTFFLTAESTFGASSSWTPLANIALGGFTTSRDPESGITGARFALGPRSESAVTRARRVRTILLSLTPAHCAVLFAAFGPTPWAAIIDQGFGRGMGARVGKSVGPDVVGVALLSTVVVEGFAAAPPTEAAAAARWRTAGGWLVSQVLAKTGAPARAGKQAARMVAEAVATYEFARDPSTEPQRRARAPSNRVRTWRAPLTMPQGDA